MHITHGIQQYLYETAYYILHQGLFLFNINNHIILFSDCKVPSEKIHGEKNQKSLINKNLIDFAVFLLYNG